MIQELMMEIVYDKTHFSFRSRCRNLHPRDLAKMKHASSAHLAESSEHGNLQMAMKTAAFLAAIKRGAHFIFHSNPGEAENVSPVFDRGLIVCIRPQGINLHFFVILSKRGG